jgi:NADPH2:quinone reductase
MLALRAVPQPPYAELAEVPDPQPTPSQALVAVRATSLNRGEVSRMKLREPGTVLGWDVAGLVERAAADGSGPPQGARVTGVVGSGAWAQRVAVPARDLAEVPEGVSFEQAATLPVAGLTPLYALDIAGTVTGRRVCVTGASGGVGRFAIQLSRLGGAHVTAVARRREGLAELGADEVVAELEPEGEPFDAILEAIGGPVLAAAIGRLAPFGTVVSFAATVPDETAYQPRDLFGRNGTLRGLIVFPYADRQGGAGPGLARLVALVAGGRLRPEIDLVTSWRDAPAAFEALLERRVAGKAVLGID